MFLLAGDGGGYNLTFSLTLPQTVLLVCLVFRRGKRGGGGAGGGSVVGGEVGRNREQNV